MVPSILGRKDSKKSLAVLPGARHPTRRVKIKLSNLHIFLETLINKFTSATEHKLSQMEQEADSNNAPGFAKIIHALKGSTGTIGATSMFQICVNVESQNTEPDRDSMREIIQELRYMYQTTLIELNMAFDNNNSNSNTSH